MKQISRLIVVFFILFISSMKAQNDGSLDVMFNVLNDQFPAAVGASGRVFTSVVQPDGKIVIGGQFTSYNGVSINRIARLNEDGSLDLSFNVGIGANNIIQSMLLLSDGKLLIAGNFTSYNQTTRNGIARINQDGSLDESFNPSLGVTGIVTMALQSNGKVLIGGKFTSYNEISAGRLARINADGSLDNTFSVGLALSEEAATLNSIIIQDDGKILIGGRFTVFNGLPFNRLVRLNSDGSVDNNFNTGSGTNNTIQTMALQPDGKIIIAGSFTNFNGIMSRRLARLNDNGSLDTTFNTVNAPNGILSIGIQPDGKILISGRFNAYNNIACGKIFRLNSNGEADLNFNEQLGANNNILNLTLQSNQKWIVVGQFTAYNQVAQSYITRIDFNGVLDPVFNSGTLIGANNRVQSLLVQPDGKSIITGNFTSYSGFAANRITRVNFDGSADNSFDVGVGANNNILAIKRRPDGKLIIGGQFTNFNGVVSNRIARLNNNGTVDVSFNPGIGANGTVQEIGLTHDGKIIIAGSFTAYNGVVRNGIARLNQDGSLDENFNPGAGAIGITNLTIQSDGKILIGGSFNSYNGAACGKMARVNSNGSFDNSFNIGSGVSEAIGTVNAIVVQLDGKIVVGGRFTVFNGLNCNRLVRLNEDGSFDTTFNNNTGANNIIQAIILQPDGKLIIAGSFTNFSGTQSRRLARLNSDGTLDTAFNAGNGSTGIVALGLQPDGKIMIGGNFTSYNNTNRNCIARVLNQIQLNIAEDSCNTTIESVANEYIYATNLPEANAYEFKIENEGDIQFLTSTSNSFRFSDLGVNNFSYGTTYDVSVRAAMNGVFTAFSDSCPISLIANPTTSMDGFCDQTMPEINSKVYFFLVPQATEYKYSITNVLTNEEQFFTTNKRFFYITDILTYDFDTEYSIKCQVKIGADFGDFGPACILTTPSAPTVELRNQYCNTTLASFLDNVYAEVLVGASAYKFKVVNNGNEQEIVRPDSRFSLGFASGIQPNTAYNISVAVFFNNAWQPYGNACSITTPLILPTSELRPQFCGATVATLASNIYAVFRVSATAYRFKTTINNQEVIVERPDSRCFMSAFAGAAINQTYSIQVAVQFNGVWSEYGNACNLTVGVVGPKLQLLDFEKDFEIKAYPNPFVNQITLSLSNENTQSDIMVYDMTGKLIQQVSTEQTSVEIGNDWSKGVYLVQIVQGQEIKNIRIVKQ